MKQMQEYLELLQETDAPQPSQWSQSDKSPMLTLTKHHQRISYSGPGKTDSDAGAVRSDFSVQGSLHYFECTVIDKGKDGYIGIGYSTAAVSLSRLPGWEMASYGYHGDDGNSFCCSGQGVPYGPRFTQGDTIGCGINLNTRTIFYTKNGLYLGVAFDKVTVSPPLYPSVGLRTIGEQIQTNFGQTRQFVYDIAQHVRDELASLWTDARPVELQSHDFELVILKHLILEAMPQSAHGLATQLGIQQKYNQEIEDAQKRRSIIDQINAGNVDFAIEYVQGLFKLQDKFLIVFRLQCRKFIEMVRLTTQYSGDQQNAQLNATFQYGQQLQDAYSHHEQPEIQSKLTEIFSLLAYTDPYSSSVGYLFNQRSQDAEMVNDALCGFQKSPLHILLAHLQSLIAQAGVGQRGWLKGLLRQFIG